MSGILSMETIPVSGTVNAVFLFFVVEMKQYECKEHPY
jgi:hypothetical protein